MPSSTPAWLELLQTTPWLLYTSAVLLGLILGSFLNVVILRLPRMMEAGWRRDCAELLSPDGTAPETDEPPLSLSKPASTCPSCGHRIRVHENIPILSYVWLRGRCSKCKTRISLRYPLVEAFTALLTLIVVIQFGPTWQAAAALLLTWSLIALAVIDLDTQLLPDSLTLPVLWLGLFLSLFGLFTDSQSAIIGAIAGYLSLWTVFQLFRLATGKEGMGYGDFKLLALLGAWLGWPALPQIILLSALVGALVGVGLILSGRHESGKPLPFGPYLAAAGWISLIWGEAINGAYLRLSGLA
ncbi:prepilin peptidase [Allochromatium vinosum]|uniref:prepilin peptidase n=1 Tax=Allochromatium vinosum TaxID=1049 RepID=UPI001906E127|nr:A24 family peptidase [Allochromatium vinosum]MBK1654612.1 prepilin peptidase [Allochromatium vinosum]